MQKRPRTRVDVNNGFGEWVMILFFFLALISLIVIPYQGRLYGRKEVQT